MGRGGDRREVDRGGHSRPEGRIAVVTGANSGLGLAATRELARAGADVVLACRNTAKGDAAAGRDPRAEVPGATVEVEPLDLASLESVRAFAARFSARARRPRPAAQQRRRDGRRRGARPPTASSSSSAPTTSATSPSPACCWVSSRAARMPASSPSAAPPTSSAASASTTSSAQRSYWRWRAYGQSKLANVLFALELDRRLRAAGSAVKQPRRPSRLRGDQPAVRLAAARSSARSCSRSPTCLLAQSAEMGRPAAALRGDPAQPRRRPVHRARRLRRAARPPEGDEAGASAGRDEQTARRLWTVSEELTGVGYAFG